MTQSGCTAAEFDKWEKLSYKKARKGEYENFSKEKTERLARRLARRRDMNGLRKEVAGR